MDPNGEVAPGTQAVHRALRMLESFRSDRSELSLGDLAEEAQLTLPTAHRIARTLHAREFLMHSGTDRDYSLGPAVMRLARTLLQAAVPKNLLIVVQPVLERLRDESGETAAVYCAVDGERMCVAEVASRHAIRMANGVGNVYPLHSGAAGKAILAWLPKREIDRLLADHPDESRLRRELGRIRRLGYAVSVGETVPAASAIASPVRTNAGDVIGAVSIAGPVDRWSKEAMAEAAPMLVELTNGIATQVVASRSA